MKAKSLLQSLQTVFVEISLLVTWLHESRFPGHFPKCENLYQTNSLLVMVCTVPRCSESLPKCEVLVLYGKLYKLKPLSMPKQCKTEKKASLCKRALTTCLWSHVVSQYLGIWVTLADSETSSDTIFLFSKVAFLYIKLHLWCSQIQNSMWH